MGNQKIGIIGGGSGSSKFVSAFANYLPSSEDYSEAQLGFIANVADNFWHKGLFICPDIDITTYALARKLDLSKGWGVQSDTTSTLQAFDTVANVSSWFQLGDQDLALSIKRTEMFQKGWSLSRLTEVILRNLGIAHQIIPATDDFLETFVLTQLGILHLQEFWVKNKGLPTVRNIYYAGIEGALPDPRAIEFCRNKAVICPANPITSILPIIRLKGISKILKKSRVAGISPFVRASAFSGPAPKLMRSLGMETSSFGVAKLYSSFLKVFLVSTEEDPSTISRIRELGIEVVQTNILVRDEADKARISGEIAAVL